MTDINVDELIAEGRWAVEALGVRQSTILVNRLADALEAVKRERDEALAVIERAKVAAAWPRDSNDVVRRELETIPADALRERDAEKWDEGHSAGVHDVTNARLFNLPPTRNPYREETTRG